MYCPYCGQKNIDKYTKCPKCGKNLEGMDKESEYQCSKCNHDVPEDAKFCWYCGIDFDKVLADSSTISGQASEKVTPMDITDFKREAEKFRAAIPLLAVLYGKALENFCMVLLSDVAKIAIMCGEADGKFDPKESMFVSCIMTGIMQPNMLDALSKWNVMPQEMKKQFTDISLPIIKGTREKGYLDVICTPTLTRSIDNKLAGTYYDKITHALYRFAEIVTKADGTVSEKETQILKKVYDLIYKENPKVNKLLKLEQKNEIPDTPIAKEETIEDVMMELDTLIGLENIKHDVKTLANFLKVQKERKQRGMTKTPTSLHAVFFGPPGTGKTTVARLLGKIYRVLGFLSKGHVIETDRAGLVAGYVGQTSIKVDELVKKSLDGVLFIDEAYALKQKELSGDYGQEAIDILLKRMEDYRERLAVIIAGYTEEMKLFLEANPGIKSRFNRFFFFDHYPPDELIAIFEKFCKNGDFKLTNTAKEKLKNIFEVLYSNRDESFGNGRLARNLFEKSTEKQSNRVVNMVPLTDEILTTITDEDIPPVQKQAK